MKRKLRFYRAAICPVKINDEKFVEQLSKISSLLTNNLPEETTEDD